MKSLIQFQEKGLRMFIPPRIFITSNSSSHHNKIMAQIKFATETGILLHMKQKTSIPLNMEIQQFHHKANKNTV